MKKIMTVLGPIPPEELGPTLPHEHLQFNITMYQGCPDDEAGKAFWNAPVTLENLFDVKAHPYANYDNCILFEIEPILKEIEYFKAVGGKSIVDVSSQGLSNEQYPQSMVEISKRAGIHVIGGMGHFHKVLHPPYVATSTIDQLANEYIDTIRNGYPNTSIRPGILGEIGTGPVVEPDEIKVLRASARAHLETDIPMNVHMHLTSMNGHQVLDIFEEEGVNLERVVLSHCDPALTHAELGFEGGLDYIRSLAARGCYTEFDLCGNAEHFVTPNHGSWWNPTDGDRARAIKKLCEDGFGDQILLSHDTGHKYYLKQWGGWGLAHAIGEFKNILLEAGVDSAQIERFSTANPQRMLTISKD